MRIFLASAAVVLLAAATPRATEQTWIGQISDSACGAKHEEAAEGAGKMPDRECTLACVRGGSKYVLVVLERDGLSRATVFQIANQDQKDVAAHAGQHVKVSGELKDKTITVSTVVAVIEE